MLTRYWQRHTSNASIKKNDAKTPPHFCGIMSIKLLEVSLSCLHFSLLFTEGEVKSPYFFASVVSPDFSNIKLAVNIVVCRQKTVTMKTHSLDNMIAKLCHRTKYT
jgi:hypothetical protein